MVYEIILGREEKDQKKYGTEAAILIGKHYVKMGQVSTLSQPVYLDLTKAHVVFVCGKRGSGKSYCMGVIAEGISKLPEQYREKLSVIMLDTMGIYWTMKFPNNKDEALLKEWGYEGAPIENARVYTPYGFFNKWKEQGIPTDKAFALNPAELTPDDWNLSFELESSNPVAVFIERIVLDLKKKAEPYDIPDIIKIIDSDQSEDRTIKNAARNRFISAQEWGLFSPNATPIKELAQGGQVTILDMSPYATMPNGWRIKQLVMGIVCMKLFIERMLARKNEEFAAVHQAQHYLLEEHEDPKENKMPICWIMIDEAHEFLPFSGKVASSDALITLLREGRQPGIAMVMATQQPGKIHTDAMTQSDVILAHRLTAKIDTDALGALLQSYLRSGLDKELTNLPRMAGTCIAVDDVNERMYPMRIRPRFSWHGGGAPSIIQEKKEAFKF
ncbi:ATP-binding protein [Candidatus Woesearchaeota archaeon]|nr:ATP-binding protein [Candidatus Woesearchaeota archaeon]